MTKAFVLGNGVSRQVVGLDSLNLLGPTYGCNALYRDFTPDVLVATDRPIATHIQESGYPLTNKFYTRRPLAGLGAKSVPHDYFGYSSGPIALSIACLDGYTQIYMIGFDMGPTLDNQFNNLYSGTEFYKPSTAIPTFTGNWVKQMCHIMSDFPTVQFYRVAGATTAKISEFNRVNNMVHVDMNTFLTRINTTKDL
jgi:hypothetical protein